MNWMIFSIDDSVPGEQKKTSHKSNYNFIKMEIKCVIISHWEGAIHFVYCFKLCCAAVAIVVFGSGAAITFNNNNYNTILI